MTLFFSLLFLFLFILAVLYGFFFYTFCHPKHMRPDAHKIPASQLYTGHQEEMLKWILHMENSPNELVHIKSHDNKDLYGHLYIHKQKAPIVLFSHGYHGVYSWDGYGMYRICEKNQINILLIDARAHGQSDGIITFGIRERFDFKSWISYIQKRFGDDQEIILAGVSMGAASMLMSSACDLPGNVKGLISDCGYSRPSSILRQTMGNMGMPVNFIYSLLHFSAKLFGNIDLESATAIDAVQSLKVPVLFLHGKQDSVVPVSMCEELFQACTAPKAVQYFETADHANCALVDFPLYEKAVENFLQSVL